MSPYLSFYADPKIFMLITSIQEPRGKMKRGDFFFSCRLFLIYQSSIVVNLACIGLLMMIWSCYQLYVHTFSPREPAVKMRQVGWLKKLCPSNWPFLPPCSRWKVKLPVISDAQLISLSWISTKFEDKFVSLLPSSTTLSRVWEGDGGTVTWNTEQTLSYKLALFSCWSLLL